MKKLSVIMVIIALMTAFAGCSAISKDLPSNTDKYLYEYPVNIDGVKFNEAPKKVASLSPAITEILYEIGVGDKLIARSNYCNYPEGVASLPSIGSPAKPDIKQIISLKPDVVLTQSPIAAIDLNELNKNGIKIVTVAPPKSYEEMYDTYTKVSQIFLGNNKGQYMAKSRLTELDKLLAQAKEMKITDSFVFIVSPELAVATGDTLPASIFAEFGKNIAKDKKGYSMSVADIVAASPLRIFVSKGVDVKNLPAEIQALPAVKNGNVITVDYSLFEKPTSRLAGVVSDIIGKLGTKGGSSSDSSVSDSSITK